MRATVETASEYKFGAGRSFNGTLVIDVTQSVDTSNTLGSTVTREVDDTAFIRPGPDIGVAATKTFALQVATMLVVGIGREHGALAAADTRPVLERLRDLPGAVQQVPAAEPRVREAVTEYGDSEAFFLADR